MAFHLEYEPAGMISQRYADDGIMGDFFPSLIST